MNENERISLTKPSGSDSIQPQGWRDPATGEIYPQPQPQYSQAGVPQPAGQNYYTQPQQPVMSGATKFCKFCGQVIPADAVVCTQCGRQVEELHSTAAQQPIIINNSNNNVNSNVNNNGRIGREKNKWVALILCFFFGVFGIHRFYEGKIVTGILWLFTGGLFAIGWLIDLIILLIKPNPYYV